jgi:YD repeat-containing protein
METLSKISLFSVQILLTFYTSGHITYYTYDSFGRVQTIWNENGQILKVYNYQYQKPN